MEEWIISLREMEWDGIIPEDDIITYSTTPVCALMPRTEEWKKRISESNKGKSLSEEHKRKISQTLKGRPLSDETKQKMSATRKGKEKTQKEIEQLNAARLKRKITGSRWWNDGQNEKQSVECPGDKWVLGRCKRVF
jgi:hypothetical protein